MDGVAKATYQAHCGGAMSEQPRATQQRNQPTYALLDSLFLKGVCSMHLFDLLWLHGCAECAGYAHARQKGSLEWIERYLDRWMGDEQLAMPALNYSSFIRG